MTELLVASTLRQAGCVFAEDEARLLVEAAADSGDLTAMVAQRVAGRPLEHVLGWAEFCGLRIAVDPGVFVPRRRTEFLARQAATLAGPGSVVVDLCCGSGAVGAVFGNDVELYAVDIDPAAVRCARRNISGLVYEGDLCSPLPAALRGTVDVLVANAPYVPTEAIETLAPEARIHEPRVALDGGADGLDILRRVIAEAPQWLTPGGHLLFEASERQASMIVGTIAAKGMVPRVAVDEETEATVVIGQFH